MFDMANTLASKKEDMLTMVLFVFVRHKTNKNKSFTTLFIILLMLFFVIKQVLLCEYFDLAGVPDDMWALSESGEIAVGSDCKPGNPMKVYS